MDEQRMKLTNDLLQQHCNQLLSQVVGCEVEINIRDRRIAELEKQVADLKNPPEVEIKESESK